MSEPTTTTTGGLTRSEQIMLDTLEELERRRNEPAVSVEPRRAVVPKDHFPSTVGDPDFGDAFDDDFVIGDVGEREIAPSSLDRAARGRITPRLPGILSTDPQSLPGRELGDIKRGAVHAGITGAATALTGGSAALAARIAPKSTMVKLALESLTNLGFELGLQETGITERSKMNLAISGGAPGIGRGIGSLAGRTSTGITKTLPGVSRILREKRIVKARRLDKALLPRTSSRTLFNRLAGRDAGIKLPTTVTTLNDVRRAVLQRSKGFKGVNALVDRIDKLINDFGTREASINGVKFGMLQENLEALGEEIATFERTGGQGARVFKRLFGAMMKDFDNPANFRGSKGLMNTFKKGRANFKREASVGELMEVIESEIKVVDELGKVENISGRNILNRLRAMTNPRLPKTFNENFTESLNKELPRIMKFFEEANEIGPIVWAPGEGALVIRSLLATSGAGIALTAAGGGDPTNVSPIVGGAAGIAGALVGVKGPEILARVLITPGGRRLVASILRDNKGIIDRDGAARIAVFARNILVDRGIGE